MKKPKKKIAFITPNYLPVNLYGSDYVVKLLAEQFAKNNYDISVITSNALVPKYWYVPIFSKKITKRFEIINNVKVYRLDCNQFFSLTCYVLMRHFAFLFGQKVRNKLKILYNGPSLKGLKELLQKEEFDIIHCSPSPLYLNKQVIDIKKTLKKTPRVIITPFFHGEVTIYNNPEFKKIFQNADVVHTISEAEKNDIHKLFEVQTKNISVIPLFVEFSKHITDKKLKYEVMEFKKKYKIADKYIILFAGVKGSMKGAIDTLSVVNMLYKKNKKYLLVAIGHNTKEWNNTKKNINKNALLDFGYVDANVKETIFSASDILCMPSKSESFGLVYLEAWHKKKPVIAADIPAVKNFVGKAVGGLLVPFGNRGKLRDAIERLTKDKAFYEKLAENGHRSVTTYYNLENLFKKYKELFLPSSKT